MEHIPALIEDILEQHHARLRRELPELDDALAEADDALRQPWRQLRALLEAHLMKEETILFPNLLALARGELPNGCGVAGPIAQMDHEHRQIAALEAQLRAASGRAGAARGALLALLDDLVIHAQKEDEQLFAAALDAVGAVLPAAEDDAPPPPPRPRPTAAAPRGRLRRLLRRLVS